MRTVLSAALLLALAAPGFAATPINETRPLSPTGSIEIENLKGRIQVRAWQRGEVRIEGSLGAGVEKLAIEGDRGNLSIKVRYPKGNNNRAEPTQLLLTVPIKADLDIDSVAADIDVQGVAPSTLSVESVSGDVFVAAAPREFDGSSVSGNLEVTVNSPEVDVSSVSGDILLRGRMDGRIDAETVSGDIDVAVNGERLREFSAESVSGNMTLIVPKDLSARVQAETFSGDLRAPGARINRPKYGPGASLDTRYGSGNGEVTIETFSGDAELRLE